jgi:hypothetical protein
MSLERRCPPCGQPHGAHLAICWKTRLYPALPRNVRMDVYHGDNVTGAENQQERLIEFRGWVIGFVDGEGCFSIGLVRQPDRPVRRGYTTGYQVSHNFVVVQGANSARCLHELREFFGVGKVYVNRRHDNHRDDMHLYSVHRRQDLIDRIIPFFRAHPLRSAKQLDFREVRFLHRAHGRRSPPDPRGSGGRRGDHANDESSKT